MLKRTLPPTQRPSAMASLPLPLPHLLLILAVAVTAPPCALAQAMAQPSFCEEVVRYLTKCPKPAVQNSVVLQKYTGRWYEIGSSAQFKFQPYAELGSACITANYTALGKIKGIQNVKVVNRGLKVINRQRQQQVLAISNGALAVGLSVRGLCSVTYGAPPASIVALIAGLSSAVKLSSRLTKPQKTAIDVAANRILKQARAVERAAAVMFMSIEDIQFRNGVINQKNKPDNFKAIKTLVGGLSQKVVAAALQVQAARAAISASVKAIEAVARNGNAPGIVALTKPLTALSGPKGPMAIAAGTALGAARGILGTSRNLTVAAREFREVDTAIGRAVQNPLEPGKLGVGFAETGGPPAPYWIIELKGAAANGYELATVFSCQVIPFLGNSPVIAYWILSRKPKVEWAVVKNAFREARKDGIWLGGENPFIVQRQDPQLCKGLWALP